jgi:mRNA interferase YafQ
MAKRRKSLDKIYEIMDFFIWGEPLPKHCCEHRLSGSYEGLTDCHIEDDWVMLS